MWHRKAAPESCGTGKLKGLGLFDLWDQVIPLAMLAVAIMGLSIRRFHKRLS